MRENRIQGEPDEQQGQYGSDDAVAQALDSHAKRVADIRANYPLNNSDIVPSKSSLAEEVPSDLRVEASSLYTRILQIIQQIARRIEDAEYRHAELFIQGLINLHEKKRATRLVHADKEIRISYQTLRLAVGYFIELNTVLQSRLKQEPFTERRDQIMFDSWVSIYELLGFVIGYIEEFTPGGLSELKAFQQEMLRRIESVRTEQKRLAASAQRDRIEPAVRDAVLENIRDRDAELTVISNELERYVTEMMRFYSRIKEVQGGIPTLQIMREYARVQLNVLESVSMLRFLKQSAEAIQGIIEMLQGFPLDPLTPTEISTLADLTM